MKKQDVTDRLGAYRKAVIQTELLKRRLDVLDEKSRAARTTNLTGMPGGSGLHADRTAYYATKIADLLTEIEEAENEAERTRAEVEQLVYRIQPDSEKHVRFIQVLEMRHLDLLPWSDIARVIGGLDEADAEDIDETRKETALRGAYRLHGDAISFLQKISK